MANATPKRMNDQLRSKRETDELDAGRKDVEGIAIGI
jgi:hypothetical protein